MSNIYIYIYISHVQAILVGFFFHFCILITITTELIYVSFAFNSSQKKFTAIESQCCMNEISIFLVTFLASLA